MTPLLSVVANHLWQSTVFACVAGLLTLLLRKNRARVRHAVWMAASFKFLIPFALLVALGSHIHLRTAAVAPQSSVYVVMDDVGQPFTASAVSLPVKQAPPVRNLIPNILIGIWAVGFIGISISWLIRWWRIRRAVRAGSPLKLEIPIRVVSSSTVVEPGVFGTVRPVLFLPELISERLTPDQLKAVISHELCHVRYRDSLIAAIQMFVETVFWFHPMVWWMGKRMVDERERACDEDVVRMGSDPGVYAEGILKVCQFYLESPVACVSGITGSDLKKRMERILKNQPGEMLCNWRKLFLVITGVTALAVPVIAGVLAAIPRQDQADAQAAGSPSERPAFEVASIKVNDSTDNIVLARTVPGRYTATGTTAKMLITFAYNLKPAQVSGGPSWINTEKFDIDAKEEDSIAQQLQKLPPEQARDQVRLMVQSLLAERFGLVVSRPTKEVPIYALTVAKGGATLTPSKLPPLPDGFPAAGAIQLPRSPNPKPSDLPQGIMMVGRGRLTGNGISITQLVNGLSSQPEFSDRVMVDRAGLTGKYDISLQWMPENPMPAINPNEPAPDPNAPSLFSALEEQLGLRVESTKGPVEMLVIDHVEKPTDNAAAPAPELGAQSPGQAPSTQSQAAPTERLAFDVVSVKVNNSGAKGQNLGLLNLPGGIWTATNASLRPLIAAAYFNTYTKVRFVLGGPKWIDSERFDIQGRADGNPGMETKNLMIQAVLEDRFKLIFHHETRQLPIYALVVSKLGKTGPQLTPHASGAKCTEPGTGPPPKPGPDDPKPAFCGGFFMIAKPGDLRETGNDVAMDQFAPQLNQSMDRPVVDRTGLSGNFDLDIEFSPMIGPGSEPNAGSSASDPSAAPSIFAALQEQLGLKLESTTGPVDVIVIDHVEEPTPN